VPVERHRHFHLNARNQGLRRLQVMTRGVAVVTAVLTGVFAALAAQSNAGRKHLPPVRRIRTSTRPVHPVQPVHTRTNAVPPPPSLPPLSSGEQSQAAPAPAPPAQAPQPSYSPPAVTSGGS
jgi:hypothetical protein